MGIKVAQKLFIGADGGESRHANPDAVTMLIKFGNGHTLTVDPAKFPAAIAKCLLLHGASQKVGDSYASAENIDDAIENAEGVLENLYEGIWIERAEGAGVRSSVLAEALQRIKPDKYPNLDAAIATVKGWDKDKRKNVIDDKTGVPELVAAYKAIQAERAIMRADAAAKAVLTGGGGTAFAAL